MAFVGEAINENRKTCGLWRRRECLVPTWRGWALLLLFLVVSAVILLRAAYPFLAVTDYEPGCGLVVEGWASEPILARAIEELRKSGPGKIYTVGGPMELGAPLYEYKTYAQIAAATLLKLGVSSNQVQAVPAPAVRQDRTFASALALGRWFEANGGPPARLTLVSEGPHARRSRLLFQKALGEGTQVGILAVPPDSYEVGRWWRYSSGFRNVVDEAIAYIYARIFF